MDSTIYRQDVKSDGSWNSRRESTEHAARLRERLAGMSQAAAELHANAQRLSKGGRPLYSPTTRGGVVEMSYDVGIEAGYAQAVKHIMALTALLVGFVVVCVRLRVGCFKALRKVGSTQ